MMNIFLLSCKEELENNSAIDIRATPIIKQARGSMEPNSDGEMTPRDRLKPGRKPLSPEEALSKRLNLIFDYIYNFEVTIIRLKKEKDFS